MIIAAQDVAAKAEAENDESVEPQRESQDGQMAAESFTGRDTIEATPAED